MSLMIEKERTFMEKKGHIYIQFIMLSVNDTLFILSIFYEKLFDKEQLYFETDQMI